MVFFEVFFVFSLSYLLLSWSGLNSGWKWVIGFGLVLLSLEPFVYDLSLGQLSVVLLLLLCLCWLCLRRGFDSVGGLFLGVVIAVKLQAWPVVVYLLLRRRWIAVFVALSVVVVSNSVVAYVVGLDQLISYYFDVGPAILSTYRGDAWNTSVYSWGWTLFAGTNSVVTPSLGNGAISDSLVALAPFSAWLSVLAVFVGGLYYVFRTQDFDIAFSLLVCVSVLVSPIVWIHYYTWVVIPLAVLWYRLYQIGVPNREFRYALGLSFLMSFCWGIVGRAAYFLSRLPPNHLSSIMFIFVIYVPTGALIGLMAFLVRVDKLYTQHLNREV